MIININKLFRGKVYIKESFTVDIYIIVASKDEHVSTTLNYKSFVQKEYE